MTEQLTAHTVSSIARCCPLLKQLDVVLANFMSAQPMLALLPLQHLTSLSISNANTNAMAVLLAKLTPLQELRLLVAHSVHGGLTQFGLACFTALKQLTSLRIDTQAAPRLSARGCTKRVRASVCHYQPSVTQQTSSVCSVSGLQDAAHVCTEMRGCAGCLPASRSFLCSLPTSSAGHTACVVTVAVAAGAKAEPAPAAPATQDVATCTHTMSWSMITTAMNKLQPAMLVDRHARHSGTVAEALGLVLALLRGSAPDDVLQPRSLS